MTSKQNKITSTHFKKVISLHLRFLPLTTVFNNSIHLYHGFYFPTFTLACIAHWYEASAYGAEGEHSASWLSTGALTWIGKCQTLEPLD